MTEYATLPGAVQPCFPLEHLIVTLRDIDAYYAWSDKREWLMDPADEDTWLLPRRAFVRIGDRAADSIPDLHERLERHEPFTGEVTFVVMEKYDSDGTVGRGRALRALRERLDDDQVMSVRWSGDLALLEELLASLPPQRKAPRKTPDGEMEKCRCSP